MNPIRHQSGRPERKLLAIADTAAQGVDYLQQKIAAQEKEFSELREKMRIAKQKSMKQDQLREECKQTYEIEKLKVQELYAKKKWKQMTLAARQQRIADLLTEVADVRTQRSAKQLRRQNDYDRMNSVREELHTATAVTEDKFNQVIIAINKCSAIVRRHAADGH